MLGALSAVLGAQSAHGQAGPLRSPTSAAQSPGPAPASQDANWERTAGWAGLATGVLALGLGVYFHMQAVDTRARGQALPPGRVDEAGALQADLDHQVTSVVLSYGLGAALASAGVVLLALSPGTSITAGPAPLGATWVSAW